MKSIAYRIKACIALVITLSLMTNAVAMQFDASNVLSSPSNLNLATQMVITDTMPCHDMRNASPSDHQHNNDLPNTVSPSSSCTHHLCCVFVMPAITALHVLFGDISSNFTPILTTITPPLMGFNSLLDRPPRILL